MKPVVTVTIAAALFGAAGVFPATSMAKPRAQKSTLQEEIARLKRSVEEQRSLIDAQQQRLDRLQNQLATQSVEAKPVAATVAQPDAVAVSRTDARAYADAGAGIGSGSGTGTNAPREIFPPSSVGQRPASSVEPSPPEIPALVDMRGVLTPKNTLVIEPSVQYAHSTNNRVALVGFTVIPAITIGLIDIRSVNRDTFIGQVAARYGVTNRFEVEARVPYVYRHDSNLTRPIATPSTTDSVFDASGKSIGDIEVAARYQLNDGGPDRPYFVANLRAKSRTGKDPFEVDIDPATNLQKTLPTGSGFWAVQPSLSAIFPSDPAVFFGNVSYLRNIKRDLGGTIGTVKPGDVIGMTLGMGLALNDKASFSVGYDHATALKTRQNGVLTPVSQVAQIGTLLLGASYRINNKSTFNFTLGVGVTSEAPDVQLTMRVPFSM